jgi:Poxvirus A32 protein
VKRKRDPSPEPFLGNEQEEEKEDEPPPLEISGFNVRVGKAVENEKKIKQPKSAELGIVPEVAFRWIFSGPSNSGKTNLARWTLDNMYRAENGKSFFDRIYLFSPTGKLDPVWKDLKGLRDGDRITELDEKGMERLFNIFNTGIKRAKNLGKDKAPHELVMIDDSIADTRFLNSLGFTKLFIAGRHGNISVFMMTQSYNKVPRTARIQATAMSMFPSKVSEIERLNEEHGPLHMNKKDFIKLVKYATMKTPDEKYPFLFIDTSKPEEERFRRCYYEILEPRPSKDEEYLTPGAYSQQGGGAQAVASSPQAPKKRRAGSLQDDQAVEDGRKRRRR